MKIFRFARYGTIVALVVGGIWLLLASSGPAAESTARQQALRAYAPVDPDGKQDEATELVDGRQIVAPVAVELSDIPAGVYDPYNQLDRWLNGEIDINEQDGIRSQAELQAMREAALRLNPDDDIQNATDSRSRSAPAPSVQFDSLDYNECCGGGGNVPPDPELAVGPNHVIAVVNVAFEIYDKTGATLVAPTTFQSFMSANPNCSGVFDPNALYDEEADRYILGIDADGSHYCLAVSQTNNPTGAWNIYAFATGNAFFDYPHAGVGEEAIYMGGNMFNCSFFCTFAEARVWAFDKWAMYNGASASSVSRGLPSAEDTPQPLYLHGWNQGTWPSNDPHYFFTNTNFNGATYTVYSWDDPFGANNFGSVGTVNLETFTGVSAGMPIDVPQQSGGTLQANDFRPQDFEYQNGFAWSVQTIACNPGGGTVNCIRWAKIDPASATIVDAGVYASSGEHRFFGDLAVNGCGDMAVGYTKSSTSMFPAVFYSGRQSGDAAGTLQSETLLKAGEISYTSFEGSAPRRWGDYTEMTIAPDGVTFWYLGEYSKNTGTSSGRWGTYIGAFSFACDPGGDPPPTATPTNTPVPGATVHVSDLDGSSTVNSKRWTANVAIYVSDSGDNPVQGATVSGAWSDGASGSSSCVTGADGKCSVSKGNLRQNRSSVAFSVTDVAAGGMTYAPGDNTDPDGDSNGTTITVFKDGPPPDPTATPEPTNTPEPTDTPVPGATSHVGDLDGSSQISGNRWQASVTIRVHDSNENAVSGAEVNGEWNRGGSDSCVTNGSGICTIDVLQTKNRRNVSFDVTGISASGLSYDSGDNHDPDGDSNGTSITINRP